MKVPYTDSYYLFLIKSNKSLLLCRSSDQHQGSRLSLTHNDLNQSSRLNHDTPGLASLLKSLTAGVDSTMNQPYLTKLLHVTHCLFLSFYLHALAICQCMK